jgi:hypothetical protein
MIYAIGLEKVAKLKKVSKDRLSRNRLSTIEMSTEEYKLHQVLSKRKQDLVSMYWDLYLSQDADCKSLLHEDDASFLKSS